MADVDQAAFVFTLADLPDREPLYRDPVAEFFREQVLNLLDTVVLTHEGEPVRVDGFRLIQAPGEQYELMPLREEKPGDT